MSKREKEINTKKHNVHSSRATATMSKHVTKNQLFTTGSIGHSADVTITLGYRDRQQAYTCSHSREGTRYHSIMWSHYRHAERRTLHLYRISYKAVPFHIVKPRIETHMLWEVSIVGLGCISSVCPFYNSFLLLKGPCLSDLNHTVWLRSHI